MYSLLKPEKEGRDRKVTRFDQTRSDITVRSPSPHNHRIHSSCLCLCLCSWSSAREEIRAVLQSVETSLSFLHAIRGQFVLWVASPEVSTLTMVRTGSAAVGREREWWASKKSGLMESLFGAQRGTLTKTAHLKRRARGYEGMNSNMTKQCHLNHCWISLSPLFIEKPYSRPSALLCYYNLKYPFSCMLNFFFSKLPNHHL